MIDMRYTVLLLAMLLIIPTAFGLSNDTVRFNSTEIGKTKSFNITINYPTNITMNKSVIFQRTDSNSRFIVTYSNRNFTTNSTKILLSIKLPIYYTLNFSEIAKFNISIRGKSINFSENKTDKYQVTMRFNNTNATKPKKFVFVVLGGNTTVNLSSTLSNRRDSLSYTIVGEFGYSVNVSCSGSWLSCPASLGFDMNNRSKYVYSYNVPLDASPGTRSFDIIFRHGNKSITRKVIFNIKEPDISMLVYNPPERCLVQATMPNSTTKVKAVVQDCLDEYQEFYIAQLRKYMDAFYPKNDTIVTEYVDHYIMYGNISKVTMDELQTCRQERADFTERMIQLNDANLYLSKNSTSCQEKRLADYKEYRNEVNKTSTYWRDLKNQEVKKAEKKWKSFAFWTIFIIIAIELIALFIIANKNELLDTLEGD